MASLLSAALPAAIQSRIPKLPGIGGPGSLQAVFFRTDASLVSATVPTTISPASSSSLSSSSLPSTPSETINVPENLLDVSRLDQTLQAASTPLGVARQGTPAWSWSGRRGGSGDSADLGLVLASPDQQRAATSSARVNWKYGQTGLRTLENALREASDPDRLPALERQIYVESVSYLLRGLPDDLDGGELHRLRQAAPGVLRGPGPADGQEQQFLEPLSCPDKSTSLVCQRQPVRSLPHVATHWLITRVYGLVVLLIPFVTSLIRLAIELDRKYHVPEAVATWCMGVFLVLCRNLVELFVTVCSLADGRVGRTLDDGTAYVAAGVVSGFREAVVDVSRGQVE